MIHLACSQAPEGRHGFPLELLADQMVQLGYIEHISTETVRTTLKKTNSSPDSRNPGARPMEADGEFVYHMEDGLSVYCRPYDPEVPQICMDEMGKNLVKDKYPPEPAKPGQVTREDETFEKEGRANLFIAYEPLVGKRCLKVTEHRTKKDWALFMQEVLEKQYPQAKKVVLVLDNLNTHTPASFYEVFPPKQGKALIDCLEIHYTRHPRKLAHYCQDRTLSISSAGLGPQHRHHRGTLSTSSELARPSQPTSRHSELAISYG